MNVELEKIVDSVLANGELTDRSRELLMKKAEQLGVDLLDFELELESKIAQKKSVQSTPPITSKSSQKINKEGDLKKCPSCGAPVPSFTTICEDCGHEFRNTKSSDAVNEFFKLFNKIPLEEKSDDGKTGFWTADMKAEIKRKSISDKQVSLISSFPVPNSKEDILEFLALSLPHSTKKYRKILGMTIAEDRPQENVSKAFKSKCKQIIIKARFSLKGDKKALEEIEYYAKQLKIK